MASYIRPFLRAIVPLQKHQNKSFFVSAFCNAVYIDDERNSFVLNLPKEKAEVFYLPLNGAIDLKDTYVPQSYRDQGVGVFLAKEVFDYCLRNNIKVKISCWYLQRFYEAHESKYRSIVL